MGSISNVNNFNNTINNLEAQATQNSQNAASAIASGNPNAAATSENAFALNQLGIQEASAEMGEIQDTLKAEIQNLAKA